ncbi:hypothetical protein GCM10025771_23530 [Niveibacterium umoris]|uniref:Putative dehydrogenase n=1 Tax=Niveibacterium umoris TaxID=1193620 RepID=A0A840BLP9_9RHOO|nr:Gfo/Idh/MocA family oxidoreductase [Niveibacterium umoris]MBB4012459.1 putative dehydrogenase [Niveibacterium umoris]
MGATVKWGLLGAARIAERALIPAIRAAGGRIVALGCRDEARGKAFAQHHDIARVQTYLELVQDPEIDAVYIGLPNSAHLPWALAALAAGKHVLCEKPLTLNANQVAQLQAAQRIHGRVAMEAFMYRFHPVIERLHTLVRDGAIGPVRLMRGAFAFILDKPDDPRWDPALGGGALYDVGCYPIDLMRHLTGELPDVLAAQASYTDRGVDHAVSALMNFGDVHAHMDCGFTLPFHQSFEVIGSHGALRIDHPFLNTHVETALTVGNDVERFPPTDAYLLMVAHFQRVIRLEEPQRYPLDDSRAQAEAIDRVFLALEPQPSGGI